MIKNKSENLIPENWTETTLGKVCKKITDGTHSTVLDVRDGDYFLLSCKNIKDGNIYIGGNERKIDKDTLNFLRKRTELQKNDILLTSVGTIGEVAYIKENDPKYEFQRSVAILKPFDLKINYLFLFYNLKSRKKHLESSAEGAVQQCLFIGRIKEISILLPPLPEQQAIASVLSSFDDKIELLREENKTLEELGQTIFKEWFGKCGVDDELPEGWRVGKLGEELKTFLGGTPSKEKTEFWENGNIPWVNSGKINEFRIIEPSEYITEEALKKSATKLLPKGTVVIAITGATLGQYSRLEIDCCFNQSVVGIKESEKIHSCYIYFWIAENIGNIIRGATGGAHQHINKENVNQVDFLIPLKETLEEFFKLVDPIMQKISDNMFQIQSLARSRDELLPRLMSGGIRVNI